MEAPMRKLIVIAALALFSTSAHAKVHEFKFGGRSMRIEVPKHCRKPSCIHVYEQSGGAKKRQGKIRIEECGQNLCGHAEGKPNEKVLIDMKPTQSSRWSGKIHDTRSDRIYTANISLKNPNALKVQGCVFGGLFCGGETWTRVD